MAMGASTVAQTHAPRQCSRFAPRHASLRFPLTPPSPSFLRRLPDSAAPRLCRRPRLGPYLGHSVGAQQCRRELERWAWPHAARRCVGAGRRGARAQCGRACAPVPATHPPLCAGDWSTRRAQACVSALVRSGATPHAVDDAERSLLHTGACPAPACPRSSKLTHPCCAALPVALDHEDPFLRARLLRVLLEAGAYPGAWDSQVRISRGQAAGDATPPSSLTSVSCQGFTPLHRAVELGCAITTAVLLLCGSAVDCLSKDGRTAAMIAAEHGHAGVRGRATRSPSATHLLTPRGFARCFCRIAATCCCCSACACLCTMAPTWASPRHAALPQCSSPLLALPPRRRRRLLRVGALRSCRQPAWRTWWSWCWRKYERKGCALDATLACCSVASRLSVQRRCWCRVWVRAARAKRKHNRRWRSWRAASGATGRRRPGKALQWLRRRCGGWCRTCASSAPCCRATAWQLPPHGTPKLARPSHCKVHGWLAGAVAALLLGAVLLERPRASLMACAAPGAQMPMTWAMRSARVRSETFSQLLAWIWCRCCRPRPLSIPSPTSCPIPPARTPRRRLQPKPPPLALPQAPRWGQLVQGPASRTTVTRCCPCACVRSLCRSCARCSSVSRKCWRKRTPR